MRPVKAGTDEREARHMCAVLNAIEEGHTWTPDLEAAYVIACALGEWAARCENACGRPNT